MKYSLVLLPILLLLSSCEKDQTTAALDCSTYNTGLASLEWLYSCNDTRYQTDIQLTDTSMLIRDQATFNSLVTGSCLPQIDFTAYDLLIGKKGLSSGNIQINYQYTCDQGGLFLDVEFVQGPTAVAPNLTYHVLVNKLPAAETIDVTTRTTF